MTQIHHIRKLYFEEGKTISAIAKETNHDRKTIRNYLEKEDWNVPVPKKKPAEPVYPSLAPYQSIITQWLLEDRQARKKQRHTAKRVYDRLTEIYGDTFTVSYRTVASFVAKEKPKIFGDQRRTALPLNHIAGEVQADFGDADFYEGDRKVSGHYLNLSFPFSNQGYLQLFKGENQQCLFEGLISIFEHIGGVPIRIWFDNASTMVSKILKEGRRNLTDSFLRFQEHYRFEAAFCNASAGWEKGNVENKVGYHRRNLLVPIPRVNDLNAFNRELLLKCDQDSQRGHYRENGTIAERHLEDRQALLTLPSIALDVSHYQSVKANAYGKFTLNHGLHEYSVSPKYANGYVPIQMTAQHVIILDDSHREFLRHPRLYGNTKQRSMLWLPYLTQLARKPAAIKYTGIYEMLPNTLQAYLKSCSKSDTGKILKTIAALTERDNFDLAVKTVETALLHQAFDPDSLQALHTRLHDPTVELPPLSLQRAIPQLTPVKPGLVQYDQVIPVQRRRRTC